ncbi:phospholipase D alpha 4 [Rhodamnia argentea]|uniref:Phospholipase D n=1 Tax=Rhodamnia argentea TaxID=178133 RepID=A0A8B8NV30_9MYRT|nr:phospholipase D alpha 4 [Rhodamnia argentea]
MGGQNRLLHGTLEATIFHATTYTPLFPISCILAYGRPVHVTIKINDEIVAKTSQERDRVWNQTFHILCAHPFDSTITVTMRASCVILGKFRIQADRLLNEASSVHGLFPLQMENGQQNEKLKLQLILWFKPAEIELSWSKILTNGKFGGLRNATFPQRSNCQVTLYQDAHHLSGFQPLLGFGTTPRRLWEDMFEAIEGAKRLIYIAGWSLNPNMVLVRNPDTSIPHALGVSLGELLKRKAEEDVAVRIMLWDDSTSLHIIKNTGVMNTHDEDALDYFRHTGVMCRLCPRSNNNFPTLFTHHQKTITVDAPMHSNPSDREFVSFLGGVDLCAGRFDTEEHSLFRTLNTELHSQDFYQTNISGAKLEKGGPRAPWHDTHARIAGEAAWDVLTNFEQRWTKQCDPSQLVPATSLANLSPETTCSISAERDWNVQILRSIDHVSASQMFGTLTMEKSIHEAYVEAIRRAERFIYIETQYFIGGCHLWERDTRSGCANLIPIEIALKVANKIKAKERFAVYIVIPMWPEGVPESEPVQDMLHWTRQTMEMMYKLVGQAIRESGEPCHPKDYLNFFCLANREGKVKGELTPQSSPQPGTQYWNAQKHRRFMVYVHSKLMIVDDTYLLIGSANVNQRSMAGQRDTEIAIGCYQTKDREIRMARGDVHEYRMSLWYEHTRQAEEMFREPETLECVDRLRFIGEEMWRIYSSEEVVDMEGVHLVKYPINVKQDGSVEDLVGDGGHFPDTKTLVRGRRSIFLPPMLTT